MRHFRVLRFGPWMTLCLRTAHDPHDLFRAFSA
jgi:hypothetical protein